MSKSDSRLKHTKYMAVILGGFLGGVVGGVATWLITDIVAIKHRLIRTTEIAIDNTDSRHGAGSLKWEFTLQPERKYIFSESALMGSFVHLESRPEPQGDYGRLDFRPYKGIKIFMKSAIEMFLISEANLFTGSEHLQYRISSSKPLQLSTKWKEFFLDFNDFALAPWERNNRIHLVLDERFMKRPDLSDVTAFGLDMKTARDRVANKIWIDSFRLVDANGNERTLFDAEKLDGEFGGTAFTLRGDWRLYEQ